jgi:uncharacterized membrane protein YhaH (DUF805 family)
MGYIRRLYSGRMGRKAFVLSILSLFFGYLVSALLVIAILGPILDFLHIRSAVSALIPLLFIVIYYYLLIVSVLVRRLHDANLSGFYALLSIIPYINFIFLIVLTFISPKNEGNRFGTYITPFSFKVLLNGNTEQPVTAPQTSV